MPALKRVGHKGADLLVPGNTLASFDAALAAGVDMIEFDVLPESLGDRSGSRLLMVHDYTHDVLHVPTLADGLAHLASPAFDGIALDLDLKLPGYEDRVVAALREHELIERTLISSHWMRSLVAIRAIEPRIRLGWSVPRVKRDYTKNVFTKAPAAFAIAYVRRRLPEAARKHLREGRIDAVMSHWIVLTPALVAAIKREGGEIYVWTVDELRRIERLQAMGVTGVITNDPRLFDRLPAVPLATGERGA